MGAPRILIIEARFYEDIADQLAKGAVQHIQQAGAGYKRVFVPGIYEIPAVIRYAIRAMELRAIDYRFAGYVVLGCAIRGATDHYQLVSGATFTTLHGLSIEYSLALGNGILTVENREQAMERASIDGRNLGGEAAKACLRMMQVKKELGL